MSMNLDLRGGVIIIRNRACKSILVSDEFIFLCTKNLCCSPEALKTLHHTTHLLSTIPPMFLESNDHAFDPVLQAHGKHIKNCRQGMPRGNGALQWAAYVSSTSVYGDHRGAWVDEDSAALAKESKGLARIAVERSWLALWQQHGVPTHIFRCGGIYGPDRSVLNAYIDRKNPPIMKTSQQRQRRSFQRYTARCHVLDICRALEASALHPKPGNIYNVVDDDPAGREQVDAYAMQLLGLSAERSRGSGKQAVQHRNEWERLASQRGEKRVSNAKLKRELGWELAFPTFREGLSALAGGDQRPFSS
jgi:nucleoside-diphosphate-sugar epimerase